ncbi:S-type pyocin domain-containing protein [Pseudomonas sp. Irchel 3A7]|uniref:S-type pyocin domain-containing protein n=1 Tax=Pseudomonas sp. Irchel 3A7 TaxID=2008913 RepID=UPI0021144A48|nr:bacteriocin immunity protein [Pseudomonas sp. Irchel 3A7]
MVFDRFPNRFKDEPMELKATLKEYTAPEFQALIDRIWAVDMPKEDHDNLINHFDRIVGHPKGADLLFYPDDRFDSGGAGGVILHVRAWHNKQGAAAFRGEAFPPPARLAPLSPLARNQANTQKINTDVTVSEHALEAALGHLETLIAHRRGQAGSHTSFTDLETNIRALEAAQEQARIAVRKFEFWKMSVQFAMSGTQRDATYARSDQAQWQGQLQQVSALHSRYLAHLANTAHRYRALHDEVQTQLTGAQEQLVRARNQAGVGPAQTICSMSASFALANKLPELLLASGASALELSQHKDLQKSIRSAVAEITWRNTSGTSLSTNEYASVLNFGFSSRADTQIYGLGVPLSELAPIEGRNWQILAQNKAEVNIPFRMGSRVMTAAPGASLLGIEGIKSMSQVYITASSAQVSQSTVRVRLARQEQGTSAFSFTADGTAPITIFWSRSIILASSSPEKRSQPRPLSFVQSPPVPLLEPLSNNEVVHFDDYIVVFPDEAGLDPLYVMFRDRREYPV